MKNHTLDNKNTYLVCPITRKKFHMNDKSSFLSHCLKLSMNFIHFYEYNIFEINFKGKSVGYFYSISQVADYYTKILINYYRSKKFNNSAKYIDYMRDLPQLIIMNSSSNIIYNVYYCKHIEKYSLFGNSFDIFGIWRSLYT